MDLMEAWDPLDHPARIEIRRQDSDDSDAEGGLGNVTRVVLRPPGHSGKAKRGHLSFDASFETGNLGRVDFVSEYEYDLFIRPDTCNPRYRMWFNFVVDNVRIDQRVIFNVVNFSKTKTLFSNEMTPLVKTSSRPKWQRLGTKYVYYHKSPEHRNHYILSFAFVFDREEDVYQFAFTFPYSYSRAETHLNFLRQRNLPFVSTQTVARSLQNRNVEVITICSPLVLTKKPKVVVIMARSHPGDSPTSYVAQGLIDFLISTHPLAGILRDHIVVKVVPMVNPDGVFIGNYRTSIMGYDLNRHWNQISPWSHPVLNTLKTYLQELDTNRSLELDMLFDLHAHTGLLGAFIYGNSYEDVYRFERHILFPKLLAHNAEDYNPTYTMYNRDTHKIGTARRHFCETLRSSINTYSLEVSVHGYIQRSQGTSNIIPYTEDTYFRLGRNIARTLAEYYRVTGIIPSSIFPPLIPLTQNVDEKKRIIRRSRSRSRPPTQEREKSQSHEVNDATRVIQITQLMKEDEKEVNAPHQSPISDTEGYDTDSLSSRDSSPSPGKQKHHQESISKGVQIPSMEVMKIHSVQQKGGLGMSTSEGRLAYRTFDFSSLNPEVAQKHLSPIGNGENVISGCGGRKVGGGGILGKQKSRRIRKPSQKWSDKLGDSTSPSLTIIDFNLLIRMGLERRLDSEAVQENERPTINKTKRGGAYVLRDDSEKKCIKSRGILRCGPIRGTVTDSSAWEDTSSDSDVERILHHNYSAPAPIVLPLDTHSAIRNEKMSLNPRESVRRKK